MKNENLPAVVDRERNVAELKAMKYLCNLGGKPYILHDGLVYLVNKKGVKSVETLEIKHHSCTEMGCPGAKEGETMFIARVRIVMEENDRTFTAEGDACPHNTTSMVRKSIRRMAETRAFNRAARIATECGFCSLEELPDRQEKAVNQPADNIPTERDTLLKTMAQLWKRCEQVNPKQYTKGYAKTLMKQQGADKKADLTVPMVKGIIATMTADLNNPGGDDAETQD